VHLAPLPLVDREVLAGAAPASSSAAPERTLDCLRLPRDNGMPEANPVGPATTGEPADAVLRDGVVGQPPNPSRQIDRYRWSERLFRLILGLLR
jgi:hypothetical protein